MDQLLLTGALWISLAVISTLLSSYLRIATALTELILGALAQFLILRWVGSDLLSPSETWVEFLASAGAMLLTFLAGTELDPMIFQKTWKEATAIGILSFLAPFLGCTALTFYSLHWTSTASWLAGIALSTTSVAVVYTVMLEFGLNTTNYGKILLAACFITDLSAVMMLGLLFAPFTVKTLFFFGITIVTCLFLPWIIRPLFKRFGNTASEFEPKFILLFLFSLGSLAIWAGSEAVLPAYLLGMALAGTVGKNHALIRRLRTLTLGLLTPFYFIRTGCLVSIPSLLLAPLTICILFLGNIVSKIIGVYPVTRLFGSGNTEGMYTTLLMSTGLTFGSISALYGFSHQVINISQYSCLIAAIIASAIIPTIIANMFFLPRHLLRKAKAQRANIAKNEMLALNVSNTRLN